MRKLPKFIYDEEKALEVSHYFDILSIFLGLIKV